MSEEKLTVMPAYLRLKNAAAFCGISEQMLLKLHRMGDGPPRIRKGRAVLYSVRALQDWMDRDQEAA
jgi:predicted DNA-binding transcriptional regulator AlpA